MASLLLVLDQRGYEGIEYLRSFLHLPPEIVPATLKRPARSETVRPRTSAAPRTGDASKTGEDRSAYMLPVVPTRRVMLDLVPVMLNSVVDSVVDLIHNRYTINKKSSKRYCVDDLVKKVFIF